MLDHVVEFSSIAVFASIAVLQLHLTLKAPEPERFDEGRIRIVQYAIGLPTLASLVVFMLDPDVATAAILPMPAILRLGGIVVFQASAILVFWAHVSLGRFWSADLETQVDHMLIETGPYRFVRHPLYTAFFGLTIGLFLMTCNWLLGLSMGAYFISLAARAGREEQMLVERLGDVYRSYALRTGRFLPAQFVNSCLGPSGATVRSKLPVDR